MNKEYFIQSFPVSVSNSKYFLILFILWPFLALLTALSNYSQKESKIVVYLFLIYYGLNFVISETGYVDAVGYALELKANAELPFSDFFKIVGGLYSADDSVDIYEPLVSFIVSRFTNDHRILFAVFAVVFGFFYLKSINLLHNLYRQNPGINALIHLIFFCVILPVTTINGVRMWTAAWIFFYGAIHVIWYRDARYLLIAMASTLVHWSFLSVNFILVIYFFAGNRNSIYLPIALASFVLPQLIAPFFRTVSLRLGGSVQSRYEGYTNEDYVLGVQEHLEQNAWFIQIGNDLVFYYLLLAFIIIQIGYKNLMKAENEKNLFSFLLLLLAFVNFGRDIPSFGVRFQLVFFLFATLYLFLYFLKVESNKLSIITLAGLFPMLIYAAVTFRVGSINVNAWIFAPGFGVPLLAPALSIADFLFS